MMKGKIPWNVLACFKLHCYTDINMKNYENIASTDFVNVALNLHSIKKTRVYIRVHKKDVFFVAL